jgi:hypothetical protein
MTARSLKGQVRKDVCGQCVVIYLVRRAETGGEVALGEPVIASVEGHPACQLAKFRQGLEKPDAYGRTVSALVQQECDSLELSANVRQVPCTTVLVVQLLKERKILLDLGDQRIDMSFHSESSGVFAAIGGTV